jgi:hypothetical protein
MILPLAHHPILVSLPVFAPAVVIVIVLLVHHMRERKRWAEEEATG